MMTKVWMTILVMASLVTNPMKMCMAMAIASCMLLISSYMVKGKCWMPTNFYMLFMGGIILMFMVLSSTMPNKKMKKMFEMKNMLTSVAMCIIIMTLDPQLSPNSEESSQSELLKSFYQNSTSFFMLNGVMTVYFFSFTMLTKNYKLSMRTSM